MIVASEERYRNLVSIGFYTNLFTTDTKKGWIEVYLIYFFTNKTR